MHGCVEAAAATVGAGRGYTGRMIKRLAFAAALCCCLGACGNKGPLVMPDAPLPAPAIAPEPAATPDASEPAAQAEGDSGMPASKP